MLKNIYYNLVKFIFITTILFVGIFYIFQSHPAYAAVTNSPSNNPFGITVNKEIVSCAQGNNTVNVKFTISIPKNKLWNSNKTSIKSNYESYFSLDQDGVATYFTQDMIIDNGQNYTIEISNNLTKNTPYQARIYLYAKNTSGKYVTQTQTIYPIVYYGCYTNINDLGLTIEPFLDYTNYYNGNYYNYYNFKFKLTHPEKLEYNEIVYFNFNDGQGNVYSYYFPSPTATVTTNQIVYTSPYSAQTVKKDFNISATITTIYRKLGGSYITYPADILNPNATGNIPFSVEFPGKVFNINLDKNISSCDADSTQTNVNFTVSIDKNQLKDGNVNSISSSSYIYLSTYNGYKIDYLSPGKFASSADGTKWEAIIPFVLNKAWSYTPSVHLVANNIMGNQRTQDTQYDVVTYYRCYDDINLQISSTLKDYRAEKSSYWPYPTYYYNSYDFVTSIDPAKLENGESVSVTINFGDTQSAAFLLNKNNFSKLQSHTYFSSTRSTTPQNVTVSIGASVYKIVNGYYYLVSPQPINLVSPAPNTLNTINLNFKDKPYIHDFHTEPSTCDQNKVTNHLVWIAKESSNYTIKRKLHTEATWQEINKLAGGNTEAYETIRYADNSDILDSTLQYDYEIIADDKPNGIFDYTSTVSNLEPTCGPNINYFNLASITKKFNSVYPDFLPISKDGIQIIFDSHNVYKELTIERRKSTDIDYQNVSIFNYNENCQNMPGNLNCRRHLFEDFGTDSDSLIPGTEYVYRIGANYIDNSGAEKFVWSSEQKVIVIGRVPRINSWTVDPYCSISDPIPYLNNLPEINSNMLRFTWNITNTPTAYISMWLGNNFSTGAIYAYNRLSDGQLGYNLALNRSFTKGVSGESIEVKLLAYSADYQYARWSDTKIITIEDCFSTVDEFSAAPRCDGDKSKVDFKYRTTDASSVMIMHTKPNTSQNIYDYFPAQDGLLQEHSIELDTNTGDNSIGFYIYPIRTYNDIINNNISAISRYDMKYANLLTMNCSGVAPVEESREISGNVYSSSDIKIPSGISIGENSVFSTSTGIIEVNNNASQKLSSYGPLNIAKWGLAQKKASDAITKLKSEQAEKLTSSSISSSSLTPYEESQYPNGKIWYHQGPLTIDGLNFTQPGTIIVDENVIINGNIEGSSIGIIANGDIIINSKDNNITNIQGFYYATGSITIN